MIRRSTILFALVLAGPALATEWQLRAGDVPLDQDAAIALTTESTLTFYDDGRSRYGPDGAYSYTFSVKNGGGTAVGMYHVAPDGSVCIDYPNGRSRCDLYVRSGDRLVLIDEKGERYPVRP